jgi:hypothetical protein
MWEQEFLVNDAAAEFMPAQRVSVNRRGGIKRVTDSDVAWRALAGIRAIYLGRYRREGKYSAENERVWAAKEAAELALFELGSALSELEHFRYDDSRPTNA